jgi:hypothetical protein
VLLQVKNRRERSSALRGPREMERQVSSVRGTRWTAGLGAGTWWRDERDEVMDDRAGARWRSSQEAWRESGPSTWGSVVCPQNHRRTISWFGPQNQDRRPNTTEMGSGRDGKLRSGGHAAGSHGLRQEDAGCGEGVAVRWTIFPLPFLIFLDYFSSPFYLG